MATLPPVKSTHGCGIWLLGAGPGRVRRLAQHHNNGLELVLVEKGQAEWSVDGKPEWVAPGSIFFTLPWQEHGDVGERHRGLELYYLILPLDRDYRRPVKNWRFHPDLRLALSAAEEGQIRKRIMALPQHAWTATAACCMSMREAVRECESAEFLSQIQQANMFSSLLIHFLRSCSMQPQAAPADSEEHVAQFIQALQVRCHEPWTLQSMAASCGLERTQFSFYVQRVTGLSPKQLLNHLRIKRACDLLEHTRHPIIDIALDCGFDSSQYFARVFKKICGCDARSYRAARRH